MSSSGTSMKLSELKIIFGGRYIVDGADGVEIVSPPVEELLIFGFHVFGGIFGGLLQSDVPKSLGQYSRVHQICPQPKVIATDEEKLAVGAFVIEAFAFLFTAADLVSAGLKSGESRYQGQ